MTRWNRLRVRWLGLIIASVAGCSSNTAPAIYPVQGQVLYEGQPLPDAQVTFVPVQSDAPRAMAQTDAQGRFRLTTLTTGDGAQVGHYRVIVDYRRMVLASHGEYEPSANLLPPHYADATVTRLEARVDPRPNDLPPFQLTR